MAGGQGGSREFSLVQTMMPPPMPSLTNCDFSYTLPVKRPEMETLFGLKELN